MQIGGAAGSLRNEFNESSRKFALSSEEMLPRRFSCRASAPLCATVNRELTAERNALRMMLNPAGSCHFATAFRPPAVATHVSANARTTLHANASPTRNVNCLPTRSQMLVNRWRSNHAQESAPPLCDNEVRFRTMDYRWARNLRRLDQSRVSGFLSPRQKETFERPCIRDVRSLRYLTRLINPIHQ